MLRRPLPLGLWFSISIAALLVAFVALGFYLSSKPQKWKDASASQQYYSQNSDKISVSVVGATRTALPKGKADHSAKQKRGEGEGSYKPFWETRLTDLLIGFFTACLVVVGWFTIKSNEGSLRAMERPWLFIEKFSTSSFLDPQPGGRPRFHIWVQNPGRTPARILGLRGKLFTTTELTDDVVDQVPLTDAPLDAAYAVAITANSSGTETAIEIEPLNAQQLIQIDAGDRILVARGVFAYLGPLGDRYETSYCAQYRHDAGVWVGYGGTKYNFST